MKSEQLDNGAVPRTIPAVWSENDGVSAGWGDAALICPWNLYLMYGDSSVLEESFEVMTGWVEYIRSQGENEYLWNTGKQYGDWLGLDNEPGSYCGSTDKSLIATAFYAYSVSLLIKVGKILNKDISKYEKLHIEILRAFRETYVFGNRLLSDTQTAYALAISFDLVEDKSVMANRLAELVSEAGNKLKTGFIGTPYLLQSLSNNGYKDLAFSLLLQEEYPSWLFSVNMGATTIWEHWDGINDKGEVWSSDMNSFNHYAYGSVADWVYGVACGIQTVEEKPGFEEVVIAPHPTTKLKHLSAKIKTKYGTISSKWKKQGDKFIYEITTPVKSTIIIDNKKHFVEKGSYVF
jgi:alpha-L-rhamnosidase